MKKIYTTLSARDLLGAIVASGAGAYLIADADDARQAADLINAAQSKREITDADEFVNAVDQLGLTAENNPRHIYSFLNFITGDEGLVCFGGDFDYSE